MTLCLYGLTGRPLGSRGLPEADGVRDGPSIHPRPHMDHMDPPPTHGPPGGKQPPPRPTPPARPSSTSTLPRSAPPFREQETSKRDPEPWSRAARARTGGAGPRAAGGRARPYRDPGAPRERPARTARRCGHVREETREGAGMR